MRPTIAVKVYHTPWPHYLDLAALAEEAARPVADEISSAKVMGQLEHARLALFVLDPTQPPWTPFEQYALLSVVINDAEHCLSNAAAKAHQQATFGRNNGVGVYAAPHSVAENQFVWGFSGELDGTYFGASGLNERQDELYSTMLVARLLYRIKSVIGSVLKQHRTDAGRWLNAANQPAGQYSPQALAALPLIGS